MQDAESTYHLNISGNKAHCCQHAVQGVGRTLVAEFASCFESRETGNSEANTAQTLASSATGKMSNLR